MSRIVRFYETGGPEVLRVEDAIQHPRKSEVLLVATLPRLILVRMAARSMKASEVWTFNS